jgi:hypothetical protein
MFWTTNYQKSIAILLLHVIRGEEHQVEEKNSSQQLIIYHT